MILLVIRAEADSSRRWTVWVEASFPFRSSSGSRSRPVSYTHLDVYKRQVLDASGILKAKLIYVTEPDHEQLEGIQSFL